MSADTGKRLEIALNSYKTDRERLEEAASKGSSSVKDKDVTKLLARFETLQVCHKAASDELSNLSPQNALPPNIKGAIGALEERKAYLKALMEQIEKRSDFDVSIDALN